mmetsp:Transcript_47015/g.92822  ORF Transcript_47015/g.92822 Transcript_47015/m.92822 type:complete len:200 (-) Transcript_47015:137-736(-)
MLGVLVTTIMTSLPRLGPFLTCALSCHDGRALDGRHRGNVCDFIKELLKLLLLRRLDGLDLLHANRQLPSQRLHHPCHESLLLESPSCSVVHGTEEGPLVSPDLLRRVLVHKVVERLHPDRREDVLPHAGLILNRCRQGDSDDFSQVLRGAIRRGREFFHHLGDALLVLRDVRWIRPLRGRRGGNARDCVNENLLVPLA